MGPGEEPGPDSAPTRRCWEPHPAPVCSEVTSLCPPLCFRKTSFKREKGVLPAGAGAASSFGLGSGPEALPHCASVSPLIKPKFQ